MFKIMIDETNVDAQAIKFLICSLSDVKIINEIEGFNIILMEVSVPGNSDAYAVIRALSDGDLINAEEV